MLQHTFSHVPLISATAEKAIWRSGITSWNQCSDIARLLLPERKRQSLQRFIPESILQLERQNAHYFENLLPPSEHWRLFPEFRTSVLYLDIETTGLGAYGENSITTICTYDGHEAAYYIHGENLQDFRAQISRYNLLVTYNGKCFDIPFIERYFNISVDAVQIDLRYVLRSLGYKGGLKRCEQQLGICREGLEDVDGYFAVLLWQEYQRNGNLRALDTLLAYNLADTVNLEILMVLAYNAKIGQTPFANRLMLPAPATPSALFQPHLPTINMIRKRYFPATPFPK